MYSHAHIPVPVRRIERIFRALSLSICLWSIFQVSYPSCSIRFVCTFAREGKYICTGGYKTDDLHSRLKAERRIFFFSFLPRYLPFIHVRTNPFTVNGPCPSLPICANFCLLFDSVSSLDIHPDQGSSCVHLELWPIRSDNWEVWICSFGSPYLDRCPSPPPLLHTQFCSLLSIYY